MPETRNNASRSRRPQTPEEPKPLGGKLPPQAVEFEEVVLGALMLEREAFQIVGEILKPEYFYKDAHKTTYAALERLYGAQAPIDLLTVSNELKKDGKLDEVGGRFYLAQLTDKVASAANIEYHARIIFQKYLQRSLITVSGELQTKAYDDSIDVQDLLDEAENSIYTLSQGTMKREVSAIAPVISEAIAQMHEAAKRKDSLSGVPSGFTGIDRVTSGWQKSTLVIIAARPAMGKTAFVLSMARNMAVNHNVPVALFSLEMSNVELVKRLMSSETEVPSEKIKNGRLTPDEWTQFDQRIGTLSTAPIYVDDTPGLSVFDLRSKCRNLHKKHGIQVVIVDYLQLMNATAMRPGSRQEEVSMISRSLKGLSKELEIPIIALSQLNRNSEMRSGTGAEGKRPQLSDLRESGAIEQDADMVCFIHRPEYYGVTEDPRDGTSLVGMAEFIIAKHRSGATADVRLRFRSELVRFEEPDVYTPRPPFAPEPLTPQTISSRMNSESFEPGQPPSQADPFAPPVDFSDNGNPPF